MFVPITTFNVEMVQRYSKAILKYSTDAEDPHFLFIAPTQPFYRNQLPLSLYLQPKKGQDQHAGDLSAFWQIFETTKD